MAKRFPDSLVIIFAVVVLAQLATYILPAGEYKRVHERDYAACEEREDQPPSVARVIPDTYQRCPNVESLRWFAVLMAIPKAFTREETAGIIFFVLVIGGVLRLMRATEAIDAFLRWIVDRLEHRPLWLIGGMTTFFGIGASVYGMSEEMVVFAPLMVAVCISLRLDAMVAIGTLVAGYACGYAAAAYNPFSVFLAQQIAGVEPYSNSFVRWCLLALFLFVSIHHLLRYAARVAADRKNSVVADIDYSAGFEIKRGVPLTGRLMAVLLVFVGGLVLFVYGAIEKLWYLQELSAIFLGVGIIVAVVGRLGLNRTACVFVKGTGDVIGVALMIGFARTVQVLLTDAKVIDTVVRGLAEPLSELPAYVSALGMLGVQTVFNFFVPSGSGQAVVTMPIMAPLADVIGLTRETAVFAYQFGDGLTNMVIPTNAILMALLVIARIPYQRWVRFVAPLLVKLYIVATVALLAVVQFKLDAPLP